MDEELEQRGVTLESFFDQATETREMVQTVQKTSNSNLSLLNELKERVRKIEIKLFDEEDKRQKEEMEAKVKEQNEKSQGSGGGSKEGGEDGGGTKGGGGGVMGFISSFIGGLVGGTVGLAVQGAGAIIGLGTGLIKKGADLAKSLRKGLSNLFGGKKNEEGGEVKPKVNANSLMNLKIDDEDKNVRGTGAKNRGREGGNFSGDQQRNERGEYASKNKEEDEKFGSNKKKKNIFGFNQGGEVDSVPAMLTPGEFVVTKDAVKKVGVNTLKGLNASVGATNKPTPIITESFSDTGEGDVSDFYEEKSSDGTVLFRDESKMTGSAIFQSSYERYENKEDGETFTETSKYSSRSLDIGVPDLIEHKDQLLGEIHKIKGFENVTIEDVIKGKGKIKGLDDDIMFNILANSDASYATAAKREEAAKIDKKARGIKEGQGFSTYGTNVTDIMSDDIMDETSKSLRGTVGYRSGQINPASIFIGSSDLVSESESTYKVGGYNQGGLVGSSIAPIIESRTESGEMKLIKDLSQSVDTNRQTLMVMGEQNQVMNAPNQNPNPVALADTPQTTPTELQDTEAPIPFASLLRQSAQRYLNLGDNAMVIS